MNAADAFDIGSFDEDDVKGIKVGACFSGRAGFALGERSEDSKSSNTTTKNPGEYTGSTHRN